MFFFSFCGNNKVNGSTLKKGKINKKHASKIKSKDITLPTKVHLVKNMVCPIVMYGWESWTIKKAEF